MERQYEELLRRLVVHDQRTLEAVLQMHLSDAGDTALDPRTIGLVRLAGCIASQAPPQSYEWSVSTSLDAGATAEEMVGVLVLLCPVIGLARVNRAAADIATALGIEIDVPGRA